MKTTVNEFRKYRTEMNEKILSSGFRDFNKFFALDNKAYIDRAVAEGATRQELYETFNIALIVGGSIVIPHLRYAMEQLDILIEEKENEKK